MIRRTVLSVVFLLVLMSAALAQVTVNVQAVRLISPTPAELNKFGPGELIQMEAVAPAGTVVEFLVNGVVRCTDAVAPYRCNYRLSTAPGPRALDVRRVEPMPPPPPPPPPPPVDCVLSSWAMVFATDWGRCAESSQTRTETWARTVQTPETNGGICSGPLTQTRTSTQACTAPPPPLPTPGALETLPLLQQSSMRYGYSFYAPGWDSQAGTGPRAGYGGTGLAFNPTNRSLIFTCHNQFLAVGEMTIPAPTSTAALPRATYVQRCAEVAEGLRAGNRSAGVLAFGNRLIFSHYIDYDANHSQRDSHFASGLDFSVTGDVVGPVWIGGPVSDVTGRILPAVPDPNPNGPSPYREPIAGTRSSGFQTGYMAHIPLAWQASFGGPAFTGWCCGPSIIGRTSLGPSVTVFDPAQIGTMNPVPATMVLGYPINHATLGGWSPAPGQNFVQVDPLYNAGTEIHGVVFPENTRSVLFIGRTGTGKFCYGEWTKDPDLVGTLDQYGVMYCKVGEGGKTYFVDPYRYQVWAYDALDLLTVKQGLKKPWDIRPYTTWVLTMPVGPQGLRFDGVTYDPATNRIFAWVPNGEDPIIHVFTVEVP